MLSNNRSSTTSRAVTCDSKELSLVHGDDERPATHLELRPIHSHVYSVIIGPPFQVFLVIGVVYRVIELLVYLREPEKTAMRSMGNNNDATITAITRASHIHEISDRDAELKFQLGFNRKPFAGNPNCVN